MSPRATEERLGNDLVLASTSPYRRELLCRLGVAFRTCAPDVDETAGVGEAPAALAQRLASMKARAVAHDSPGAVVIGSDQVAHIDGHTLGKPGSATAARAQLAAASARCVQFDTAICVLDTREAPWREWQALDTTRVMFRALDPDAIARYVEIEQPLDCAGSFKAEGLGITLFERIEGTDPTALIGLPLIALAQLLRAAGFMLP